MWSLMWSWFFKRKPCNALSHPYKKMRLRQTHRGKSFSFTLLSQNIAEAIRMSGLYSDCWSSVDEHKLVFRPSRDISYKIHSRPRTLSKHYCAARPVESFCFCFRFLLENALRIKFLLRRSIHYCVFSLSFILSVPRRISVRYPLFHNLIRRRFIYKVLGNQRQKKKKKKRKW